MSSVLPRWGGRMSRLAFVLVVGLALTSACERPFVAEVPPSIEILSPDFDDVLLNPIVPIEIRASSFRPVVRVEINGDTLAHDTLNDVWRDTLHVQPGLNTFVIKAYDQQGVEGVDTTQAVYLPLGVDSHAPALPTPRGGHAATRLADGNVLVTGGAPAVGASATSDVFLLPEGGSNFERLPGGLQVARTGHTATLLPDGRVLIVGGTRADTLGRGAFVEEVEVFDPATRRFELVPVVEETIRRARHTTSVYAAGDSVVLQIYGGVSPSSSSSGGVETREDLRTYVFRDSVLRPLGPSGTFYIGQAIAGHTQTPLEPSAPGRPARYLVAGTYFALNYADTESFVLQIHSPTDVDVRDTGPFLEQRTRHAAASLLPGTVIVHGGTGETSADVRSSMELYVEAAGRFFRLPFDMEVGKRFGHTATNVSSQRILIAGGFDPAGNAVAGCIYLDFDSE